MVTSTNGTSTTNGGLGCIAARRQAKLICSNLQPHAMSLGHHSLPAMAEQMFTTMPMPFLGMYRPWHDGGTRCVHCRWVDVTPTGGMGCLCPKCLYGQASPERTCCSYEREPGADDELS
jgi:hypothetical protein